MSLESSNSEGGATGGGASGSNDVDALLSSIEPQGREIPMSAPEPVVEERPQGSPFEIDWKGQKVALDLTKKEDADRLRQWAQKGYDYNQNISAFKADKEGFLKERQEWEKQWSPYKEIDEFAKQNQDWWNHVQQSYQQRQQPQQPQIPDELKSYLDPIVQDYSQVKSFINDYQKQIVERQTKEQDAQLETEIKSISSKYNLDFAQKDESGQSLEQKVINHAVQHGFPTFKAAFYDFYQDNLEKLAEARGKEAVMQEIKRKKELGLLSESKTPSKFAEGPQGFKGRSWNDVHSQVLRDLNLA